jgi:hypothetical protein
LWVETTAAMQLQQRRQEQQICKQQIVVVTGLADKCSHSALGRRRLAVLCSGAEPHTRASPARHNSAVTALLPT